MARSYLGWKLELGGDSEGQLRSSSEQFGSAASLLHLEHSMTWFVVIRQENDQAVLPCDTFAAAVQLRQSFLNYGKYQSVEIVGKTPSDVEFYKI